VCPGFCGCCESSNRDACTCPYQDYVDATCASAKKKINELIDKTVETMKERVAEYSHCFNQSWENCREHDSSLESPESKVSLYNDFEPSYQSRSNLHDDMSFLI